MAYTQHNFVSGMKLTAQDMAEVDAQIAANEADIRALESGVAAVPSQRKTDIRKLSLTADSDSIYLYFGDELLGSVSMPDIIAIADLAIAIQASQPSNANTKVWIRSDNNSEVIAIPTMSEFEALQNRVTQLENT